MSHHHNDWCSSICVSVTWTVFVLVNRQSVGSSIIQSVSQYVCLSVSLPASCYAVASTAFTVATTTEEADAAAVAAGAGVGAAAAAAAGAGAGMGTGFLA